MTLSPTAIAARVGAWLIAVVTTIVGISLASAGTVIRWTSNGDGTETGETIDVSGIGTGLLCVGLLVLAALLLLEGYGPKRVIGSDSTPDA